MPADCVKPARKNYRMIDSALSTPLVTLEQVALSRQGQTLLDNIQLTLASQQFYWLIGRNGAGKSTLLKIIAGLIKPSSGQVKRKLGLRIGYVPQKLNLPVSLPMTVRDFLAICQPRGERQQGVLKAQLAPLALERLLPLSLTSLSGGERQRVLLAQALLQRPQLLLLDEPMQGLDWRTQQTLQTWVHDLPQAGMSVVMVSHDLPQIQRPTDWVICLDKVICCQGAPDHVMQHHAYQFLYPHDAKA